jgi:hypothetical protein
MLVKYFLIKKDIFGKWQFVVIKFSRERERERTDFAGKEPESYKTRQSLFLENMLCYLQDFVIEVLVVF